MEAKPYEYFVKYVAPWLGMYVPNSANPLIYPELTLSGACNLPARILALMSMDSRYDTKSFSTMTCAYFARGAESEELTRLFEIHGSDKGSHGYAPVYAKILADLSPDDLSILEIGLGTNHPEVVSTMGINGRPGASVRAFRDYLPQARIYGADIDERILFAEERIATGVVDQRNPASFDALLKCFGRKDFSLIIDDGLHSPEANLNVLLFGLGSIKTGGYIVIEDIALMALPVWEIAGRLLDPQKYEAYLLRGKETHASLFVVHKTAD